METGKNWWQIDSMQQGVSIGFFEPMGKNHLRPLRCHNVVFLGDTASMVYIVYDTVPQAVRHAVYGRGR